MHLYTLQIATKLLLQVVAVQDAGMIRMNGGASAGIRAAINAKLDEPHNWKEKMQVAYGILSGWHGVKNIYQ